MFKYEIKRISDGVITHFEEVPIRGQHMWVNGVPFGWGLENNFEIIETDMTDIRAADAAAAQAKIDAKASFKALDTNSLTSIPAIRDAIKDIQDVLS